MFPEPHGGLWVDRCHLTGAPAHLALRTGCRRVSRAVGERSPCCPREKRGASPADSESEVPEVRPVEPAISCRHRGRRILGPNHSLGGFRFVRFSFGRQTSLRLYRIGQPCTENLSYRHPSGVPSVVT